MPAAPPLPRPAGPRPRRPRHEVHPATGGETALEGGRQSIRRLADEVAVRDVPDQRQQIAEAAGFRSAAGDPVDVVEARETPGRGLGIGRLAVVDEPYGAQTRHLLHAVRQALERGEAGDDGRLVDAQASQRRYRRRGVLVVVRAAQALEGVEPADRSIAVMEHALGHAVVGVRSPADAHDVGAASEQIGGSDRGSVVDAHDRMVVEIHAGEEPALGTNVIVEIAVPIEMIGRQVEPDRHVGMKVAAEVELEGGELEHHGGPALGQIEIEDRPADIAAQQHLLPCGSKQMVDERRRRRLAVGARDGDQPVTLRPQLGSEEIDVAGQSHTGLARLLHQRVRCGVGQRNARADDEEGEAGNVACRARSMSEPVELGRIVVEHDDLGAGPCEPARRGEAAPAHTEDADLPAGEHRRIAHRSFNVERPISARMEAMIQNRMTMVGSCQPFFSK